MTRNQHLQLGPDSVPVQQGRTPHGKWRAAYRRAAAIDARRAVLDIRQDPDRLAFALAEGEAAEALAARLADVVWARELSDDGWPQAIRDELNTVDDWAGVPSGRTTFVCGRLERGGRRNRIKLTWLGLAGVQLYDRAHAPLPLDLDLRPDEGWSARQGIEPAGAALHSYRGELRGVERLVLASSGAQALGDDVVDISLAELEQALDDWAGEAPGDLLFFDLRLNPTLSEPPGVSLTYYWSSPELCVLLWRPSMVASGYRIEQAAEPMFESPTILAELTDGRQVQYAFSPPPSAIAYYRVIPLSWGVAGPPSAPVTVLPLSLTPPVMQPIAWSPDGGYLLQWSAIPQADAYEVQASSQLMFEAESSYILYRGEAPELYLPPSTPPGHYYRVRSLNTRYAPQQPSVWSRSERAPITLPSPVFTEVDQDRITWNPVPGARQYEVRFRSSNHADADWESLYTTDPYSPVAADQSTTYRVRALRRPHELHTASQWSAPVTLAPPLVRVLPRGRSLRAALPLLLGVALVALIVGGALGLAGGQMLAEQDPTRTPDLTATVQSAVSTALAATLAVQPALTPDRTSGLANGVAAPAECMAASPDGEAVAIRRVAHPQASILARVGVPVPVLERRVLGDAPGETWLRVQIPDQEREGWVAAPDVVLTPEGCAEGLTAP